MLLFIGTGPAFAVAIRYALRHHALRLRTTADERRSWYYESLMTERDSAAELRLFSLGARFRTLHRELRARLRQERVALTRTNALDEVLAGTIALATAASGLLWVFWRVLQGAVTLGAGAMFYQALNNGFRLSRTLLDNVGQLYYNSLFLGNLFEFLSLEPQITSPAKCVSTPRQLATGIRFEAVTFRYPGSETPALADFTLEIPAGRMVAFVGPNGAGKSTFIKLLCRFYDPSSGRITIDGADLRQLDLEDLRGRITVLFQEPVRYNASAAENISLGGMASVLSRERVEQAAEEAGAADLIARLPHGYDNLLGKQFLEGAELSSGEWQRIALARAFYREAPLLILDEPTSAMDPWAEADWLDRFRTLAAGRTSILITHRFSTAMHADIIHVMHEGRVLESGSHEQLVALGGLYARSWRDQVNRRSDRHSSPHAYPPELSPA